MHRKSVCLCELWQEGGAYGKRHRRGPAVLPHMLVPCLSTESVGNFVCVRSARRSLTAGA
ncbi:hypothetical protein DMH20_26695 [Escherichia coli]|nr:hypothetical protein [Escherichia coli]